jgi:hypothetical protein
MALIINTTNLPNNRQNEAITSFLLLQSRLTLLLLKFPIRLLTVLRRVSRGNAENSLGTFGNETPLNLSEESAEYLKVRAPASITSNVASFFKHYLFTHSPQHLRITG